MLVGSCLLHQHEQLPRIACIATADRRQMLAHSKYEDETSEDTPGPFSGRKSYIGTDERSTYILSCTGTYI